MNSFKVTGTDLTGNPGVNIDQRSKYHAILIQLETDIPNLIIRPSSIREKITNFFLNFDVKLDNRNEFNNEYILESNANKLVIEKILSNSFTDNLLKYKDLCIEFNSNTILLKFEKELNPEDSIKLVEIAKIIELEFLN